MIFKVFIFIILIFVISSSVLKRTINKDDTLEVTLDCSGLYDIMLITYAKYYAGNAATNVTNNVSEICKDKLKCSFIPISLSFVDPLPGYPKQFHAQYFCLSNYYLFFQKNYFIFFPFNFHKIKFKENKNLNFISKDQTTNIHINCDLKKIIFDYGEFGSFVFNCFSIIPQSYFQQKCHEKSSCIFNYYNDYPSSSPCPGNLKYQNIFYKCQCE